MKLTFELVVAPNAQIFNELVNQRLSEGYKFVTGQQMIITPSKDDVGDGFQYSVAMLLEEEV